MATRNESECIVEIVRKLASVLSRLLLDTELVIADYSEDDTLELAVETGARLFVKNSSAGNQPSRKRLCLADGH